MCKRTFTNSEHDEIMKLIYKCYSTSFKKGQREIIAQRYNREDFIQDALLDIYTSLT